MVRKFFALDKNYLLEQAQLSLQDPLLISLIEKSRRHYELIHNPLQLKDAFSLKIQNYHAKNLKPLDSFYQSLAGIYRYKFGNNQLEFLWDGTDHFDQYQRDWSDTFHRWSADFLKRRQFIQAVLDLTVFLPENRHAHLAGNRMNFAMLEFFSQQEGFPELRIPKKRGIVEMRVA